MVLGIAILALCGGGLLAPNLHAEDDASFEELRQQGERFYELRQYAKAIETFERAIGHSKGDEKTYVGELLARSRSALGMELFSSGETRQAERMFRSALAAAADPYAHFGLGYLAFVRFDDPGAREHLQHAFALQEETVLVYKMLALLDYRKGRSRSALKLIQKALELDGGDPEARALSERWRKQGTYASQLEKSARQRMVIYTHRTLNETLRKKTLRRVEIARAEVETALSHSSRNRLVVVLYPDAVFSEMTGTQHWVGGTYDGQIKLPVVAELSAEKLSRLEADLRHEITHAVISELAPECPVWLNEGIAQHFQNRGRDPAFRARVRDELRTKLLAGADRKIALSELPVRLAELEDEQLVRWSYSLAHGFVDFLVERYHEFRLGLLLNHLAAEGSVVRAFRVTYGASLEALESQWWHEITATQAVGRVDAATNQAPTTGDPRQDPHGAKRP